MRRAFVVWTCRPSFPLVLSTIFFNPVVLHPRALFLNALSVKGSPYFSPLFPSSSPLATSLSNSLAAFSASTSSASPSP